MGLPVAYWLRDTKLELDNKSPEGISFIINPKKVFSTPSLEEECKFNELDENGMPKPDESGQRTRYTANEGLCGLCLRGGLGVDSGADDLAYSDSDGVVGVKIKSE